MTALFDALRNAWDFLVHCAQALATAVATHLDVAVTIAAGVALLLYILTADPKEY